MTDELRLRLGDTYLGRLRPTGRGRVRLSYDDEVVARFGNAPWLSCSLPIRSEEVDATQFLRGLLPEGQFLNSVAARAEVLPTNTFGLLNAYGRDVAGALVAERERGDRTPHVVLYTDEALADAVGSLDDEPFALKDDSELSLAGLQNKMLLVRTVDGWARPAAGYPSTHILKVEDRRFPGLVAAEAACMGLARAMGLTSVQADAAEIGGLPVIVVERFDRQVDATGHVHRLQQEDACQATGRDHEQMSRDEHGRLKQRGKYQIGGGPPFAEIAELLDLHATDAVTEHRRLLALATFTAAIGNSDAHGKNLALLHPTPYGLTLAPAYDTVPTVLWSTLRDRAAMFINGKVSLSTVTGEDLALEALKWRILSYDAARTHVVDTLEALLGALGGLDRREPIVDQLHTATTERISELLDSV